MCCTMMYYFVINHWFITLQILKKIYHTYHLFHAFFKLSTPLVLQIKKIELISAPTYNQESEVAPRMLKLTLTDGKVSCFAIEFESLPKIRFQIRNI